MPKPIDAVNAPFLAGGGTAGALIRSIDWSKTPVGPLATWPRSLISVVGTVLHSRHPMFLWWGPELVQFYNDAYIPSFGRGKHPAAMGQRGRECWEEIWSVIYPQIDDARTRGKASWNEDALVPIFRNDRMEEVYWTYGYSPVFDDDGGIGGVLVVCTETTSKVVATRRSEFVRLLGDKISVCTDLREVVEVARRSSLVAKADVSFLLSYGRNAVSGDWEPTGSANVADDDIATLDAVVRRELNVENRPRATRGGPIAVRVTPVDAPWAEPTTLAVVVAPNTPGVDRFILGVSPRLPFDGAYQAFFEQIAEQVDLAASRLEAFRVRAVVESERTNLLLQAPVATALLTGPTHVFELANPLFVEIVGGRAVLAKACVDAFPEIAGTPLVGVLDRVYQTGDPFVAQEYLVPLDRKGDGTLQDYFYRFNLEPLRDSHGAVGGMMVVAMDITEQVHARKILERATTERERLLKQLEDANHAKDEFLATVSHELRTPLTSILGWARVLRDGKDPSRLQKGLAVIEKNAKAQAKLIEDILDVSRIISRKVRMNMLRVDPTAAVRAATETVRPLAAAKQIRLAVNVGEDLGALIADEDRLEQIVWNLLSNAVKFTPENGDVSVSVTRESGHVVIVVRDTGKGISPEFLPHVFDRFRQDDTSTTKQQAGLGLGLSIVRHLVDLHGGSVVALSEGKGRGATFEVRLPVGAVEHRTPDRASVQPLASVNAEDGGNAGPLRDVRVLIVDDQEDARELVATVLEDAGAAVIQVQSVAAAMEALSSERIAVVVSDIGMPEEDGYALISRLRSNEASVRVRGLPALALTAYASREDRARALGAGFQDHVAKPIDPVKLVEAVAALVRR